MATSPPIVIHVVDIPAVAEFITTMHEIAGTTNDPNTATNMQAAFQRLHARTAR